MPVPTDDSKSTSSSDNATQKPRRLVLCFDGTKDKFDNDVTNVIKLYSILAKDKVEDQLCYYQVSAPHFTVSNASYVFVGRNRDILFAGYSYAYPSLVCGARG